MDVTQDSLLEIDIAFRCGQNCTNTPYTNLLVRPIIFNRLINPQEHQEYMTTFLDKRRYFGIDTANPEFDTVLDYQIANFNITTDESIMPWETY